jgi:hypothetical protein
MHPSLAGVLVCAVIPPGLGHAALDADLQPCDLRAVSAHNLMSSGELHLLSLLPRYVGCGSERRRGCESMHGGLGHIFLFLHLHIQLSEKLLDQQICVAILLRLGFIAAG